MTFVAESIGVRVGLCLSKVQVGSGGDGRIPLRLAGRRPCGFEQVHSLRRQSDTCLFRLPVILRLFYLALLRMAFLADLYDLSLEACEFLCAFLVTFDLLPLTPGNGRQND